MNYTPKQLAEMLEEHNNWRKGKKPFDEPLSKAPISPKELSIMLEQAAAMLRKLEWQPIETAKEGETILCWGQDFDFMQVADLQESGEWRMFEYDGGFRVSLFPPTHWLPLDILTPPTNENNKNFSNRGVK